MQETVQHSSPSWLELVFYALAAFLGGGGAATVLGLWVNRKKTPVEIDEAKARTRKLNVESDVELNAIIERLHMRIDEMQLGIDKLRNERDDALFNVAQMDTERRTNELFIGRLHAATKLGLELRDLPPTLPEVIMMLQRLLDRSKTELE